MPWVDIQITGMSATFQEMLPIPQVAQILPRERGLTARGEGTVSGSDPSSFAFDSGGGGG